MEKALKHKPQNLEDAPPTRAGPALSGKEVGHRRESTPSQYKLCCQKDRGRSPRREIESARSHECIPPRKKIRVRAFTKPSHQSSVHLTLSNNLSPQRSKTHRSLSAPKRSALIGRSSPFLSTILEETNEQLDHERQRPIKENPQESDPMMMGKSAP